MQDAFIIGLKPSLDSNGVSTEELSTRAGLNTGNLVYAHAISSHVLGTPQVLDIGVRPERMNAAGRVGIVQGANQLGPHFSAEQWPERFAQLTVGLVIVGLGAQGDLSGALPEVPEGALDWIRRIVERAPSGGPNVGVRGTFTMSVLNRYDLAERAEITGCPSLFISPNPRLGQEIARNARRPGRIAVVAGHEGWRHLGDIEASLAGLVSDTDGSYIGQHGLNMMKLTRGEAGDLPEEALQALCDYTCPGMGLAEFVRWSRRHGRVFFDVKDWMTHCREFDLVVGTRIHGTVVALQAGTPAVCIVHDSRTLELCETMRVPHVRAEAVRDGIDRELLADLFVFDPDAFDENRRRLCSTYVSFLERNGVRTMPWLRELANHAGDG